MEGHTHTGFTLSGPRNMSISANMSVYLRVYPHIIHTHLPILLSPFLSLRCLSFHSFRPASASLCITRASFHPLPSTRRNASGFPLIYRHISSPGAGRDRRDGDSFKCHPVTSPISPAATVQQPRASVLQERTRSRVSGSCAEKHMYTLIFQVFPSFRNKNSLPTPPNFKEEVRNFLSCRPQHAASMREGRNGED